jgi:Bardet-Biedl syndrome 1 protein
MDRQPRQLWLDAWADPVAGVNALTPCVHTCNLMGDGDWRLVVADTDRKLKVKGESGRGAVRAPRQPPCAITGRMAGSACARRRRERAMRLSARARPPRHARQVWRGTARASEHELLEAPVAVTSFAPSDSEPPPRLPVLAVAAGCHVYMFRGLRPHYKFAVPPLPVGDEEARAW